MKTISGIEFASEHNGTDVFRLIELAYEQGRKDGHSEQLGTNLAEVGTGCSEFPNNSDTISRQAAIDAVRTVIGDNRSISVCEAIEQLPSAQPEIIRCKDCKYWTRIKRTNRYWCKTDDGLFDLNPSPDDFCSRAERRTDG